MSDLLYRNLVVEEDELGHLFRRETELLLGDVVVGKLDEGDVGFLQLVVNHLQHLERHFEMKAELCILTTSKNTGK